MKRKEDNLWKVANWLAIIGAINWLLVAWKFNLVEFIGGLFGGNTLVSVVYWLVGISGVWLFLRMSKIMK